MEGLGPKAYDLNKTVKLHTKTDTLFYSQLATTYKKGFAFFKKKTPGIVQQKRVGEHFSYSEIQYHSLSLNRTHRHVLSILVCMNSDLKDTDLPHLHRNSQSTKIV